MLELEKKRIPDSWQNWNPQKSLKLLDFEDAENNIILIKLMFTPFFIL